MDFSGTWKNQHGSLLQIRMDGMEIRGRFESAVGEQGEGSHGVDISGKAQDDLITFFASLPSHGSLVSWVGQHTVHDGVDQIQAGWLHVTNVPDDRELTWMWSANRVGFDIFERA